MTHVSRCCCAGGFGFKMAGSAYAGAGLDQEHTAKLIRIVKDALSHVMNQAGVAITQNTEVDLALKSAEGSNNKLEKSLEDFYFACDQLQIWLELMQVTESQTRNSVKYTPKPVLSSKTENNSETQTYAEYLSTVRSQIGAAKELHDMLLDFTVAQLS